MIFSNKIRYDLLLFIFNISAFGLYVFNEAFKYDIIIKYFGIACKNHLFSSSCYCNIQLSVNDVVVFFKTVTCKEV